MMMRVAVCLLLSIAAVQAFQPPHNPSEAVNTRMMMAMTATPVRTDNEPASTQYTSHQHSFAEPQRGVARGQPHHHQQQHQAGFGSNPQGVMYQPVYRQPSIRRVGATTAGQRQATAPGFAMNQPLEPVTTPTPRQFTLYKDVAPPREQVSGSPRRQRQGMKTYGFETPPPKSQYTEYATTTMTTTTQSATAPPPRVAATPPRRHSPVVDPQYNYQGMSHQQALRQQRLGNRVSPRSVAMDHMVAGNPTVKSFRSVRDPLPAQDPYRQDGVSHQQAMNRPGRGSVQATQQQQVLQQPSYATPPPPPVHEQAPHQAPAVAAEVPQSTPIETTTATFMSSYGAQYQQMIQASSRNAPQDTFINVAATTMEATPVETTTTPATNTATTFAPSIPQTSQLTTPKSFLPFGKHLHTGRGNGYLETMQ